MLSTPREDLRRAVVILVLACACLPHPSFSLSALQPSPEILAKQEVPGIPEILAAIDVQLRRGEWAPARDAVLSLIEGIRASLDASELASAVARLALAEAGMGQQEDALWHWHVALNLDRAVLSPEALASFGSPGDLLARHPLRQPGAAPAVVTVLDLEDPKVRAGRRLHGTIRLSEDVAALPAPLGLKFKVILGPEGLPNNPLVVDPGPPGMVWEILEWTRGWRLLSAQQKNKATAGTLIVYVNTQSTPGGPSGRWSFRVQRAEVETLIRAGRWQEAQSGAQTLWDEILKTQQPHPVDVATIFTLRALTQAALGMEREAVCRWQAAQFLSPRLKDLDLSFYGSAGELLAKNLLADETPAGSATIETQHKLAVPPASRLIKMKGTVALAATVGPDGAVRQPRLLKTEANGHAILEGLQTLDASQDSRMVFASRLLAFSALDTVCGWSVRSEGLVPVQTVLELPFEITRLAFVPASGSGWTPIGPPRAESPRHYPQPTSPGGPRTPVRPPLR
jgi:hypothetical protein